MLRLPVRRIASLGIKLVAVILGLTAVSYAASASAAPSEHYTAFGWHSMEFDIRPFPDDVPEEWNAMLARSVGKWNNAHPNVKITIAEDSRNTILFSERFAINDGRDAEYRKICLPTGCWFEISIIDTYIDETDTKQSRLMGEFLILHELGHALGLNDFVSDKRETHSVMSHYVDPTNPPHLHPYDRELIAQRVKLMESSGHQLIPTLTLGIVRPAAEWVVTTLNPPPKPVAVPPSDEQIALLEGDRAVQSEEVAYQRAMR